MVTTDNVDHVRDCSTLHGQMLKYTENIVTWFVSSWLAVTLYYTDAAGGGGDSGGVGCCIVNCVVIYGFHA